MVVTGSRKKSQKDCPRMWNEGERASRFITWVFGTLIGLLVLAAIVGTALCCGIAAAANILLTVLLVLGMFIAFGLVANGAIIGALALVLALLAKTFRFLFPIKHC